MARNTGETLAHYLINTTKICCHVSFHLFHSKSARDEVINNHFKAREEEEEEVML